MDITDLSMDLSMARLSVDMGVALLDQSMDMVEELGDGMIKMMESSVMPYLGQNIDISI